MGKDNMGKQLREGTEEGGRSERGEGMEESGRRMEAEISQGCPKVLLATQNASQKSLGRAKIRKLGGQSLNSGK